MAVCFCQGWKTGCHFVFFFRSLDKWQGPSIVFCLPAPSQAQTEFSYFWQTCFIGVPSIASHMSRYGGDSWVATICWNVTRVPEGILLIALWVINLKITVLSSHPETQFDRSAQEQKGELWYKFLNSSTVKQRPALFLLRIPYLCQQLR